MFEQNHVIAMGQVDAAGVVFAPKLLELAHGVYEAFMTRQGWSISRILGEGWALPVRHMDADYHLPMQLGDEICLLMDLERLGENSFTLNYRFLKQGELAASAKSVHVAVENGVKHPLPDELKGLFSQA